MKKYGAFSTVVAFISSLCGASLPNESAIDLIHKYIDANLDKFECTKISSTPDHPMLIITYGYNGVNISQCILPGKLVHNLSYKLNDVEIDMEIGKELFYRIEDGLKELEKRPRGCPLNRHDTCWVIEDVVRAAMGETK